MVRRTGLSLGVALLLGGLADAASALVIGGSSLAYGEEVSLVPTLLSPITSPAQPEVSGSAPAPYDESETAFSLNLGTGVILAGTLSVKAASDVDGSPGPRSASADAAVAGLTIGGALAPVLTLSSSSIASSAQVSGNGSLAASGATVLEGLEISVLGVPLAIPANAPPNTLLIDADGVRIVLNEQVTTGDGASQLALTVNALRIEFTNAVLGLGLLNGTIVVSHSESALSAVPEPSLALLALAGAAGVAAHTRRPRH